MVKTPLIYILFNDASYSKQVICGFAEPACAVNIDEKQLGLLLIIVLVIPGVELSPKECVEPVTMLMFAVGSSAVVPEILSVIKLLTPPIIADDGIPLKLLPVNVGAVPVFTKVVVASIASLTEPFVNVACFPLSCVCMLLVASKYDMVVAETPDMVLPEARVIEPEVKSVDGLTNELTSIASDMEEFPSVACLPDNAVLKPLTLLIWIWFVLDIKVWYPDKSGADTDNPEMVLLIVSICVWTLLVASK